MRAVDIALTTHAHSDHARRGAKQYICLRETVGLLKVRLGKNIQVRGVDAGERIKLGGVWVSFHPAGHILGSAQIRMESGSQVWVASGDYKREADPTCPPWEIVPCDTFITEATFGTPSYRWEKCATLGRDIFSWWQANAERGVTSVLFGYSLGKTQRILGELAPHASEAVLLHGAARELTEVYRDCGVKLAPTEDLDQALGEDRVRGRLILAPPSVLRDPEIERKLGKYETAFASGWMAGHGSAAYRGYDRGFVMSDHADWDDLQRTIRESGAKEVYVQHRGEGALVRSLRTQGLRAHSVDKLALQPGQAPRQLSLF